MAQETNQTSVPMLCAAGCGFYGILRTNGMCSECHKEHLSKQNNGVSSLSAMSGSDLSSGDPSAESSAIQKLEATLNNAAAAAGVGTAAARAGAAAAARAVAAGAVANEVLNIYSEDTARSMTQEMMKMSLSYDEGSSANVDPVVTELISLKHKPSTAGEEPKTIKPRKIRCFVCHKKLGLTGFDCRCGNMFCGIHRYSDKHNCPYDYKTEGAAKIRKENPVVVAEKIQRI
ncbi:AN1-type zinc finger protein 5-like [Lampris incognitus]|uniref:AN1-type zinc finger protein 5-like n=1 Tax=Lampris incognitus TaxID=2546036 RepID=UPI0024B4EF1C|nr:AN1-type zinc finger protein 5-like [Lampris incognitus]XP_056146356.1 AN1-type zinc finger protein 5-like [Lampris incognitus]